MKGVLEIFITYGHNEIIKDELVKVLKSIKGIEIKTTTLKEKLSSGDRISESLERYLIRCDLAIILATEDDYASVKDSNKLEARARQNVWMEFGFFWAKLGLSRTLLLVHEKVTVPSNINSNYYIKFGTDLSDVRSEIKKHIKTLSRRKPANLTEILYLNNNPNQLDLNWRELTEIAYYNLVITGISFRNMRKDLNALIDKLRREKTFKLTLIILDPFFMIENEKLFRSLHGNTSIQDNLSFFIDLNNAIRTVRKATYDEIIKYKLQVKTFSGYFTGSTVYCEDINKSKHMIFAPFLYKARDRGDDHVRFRLKKRSDDGAFDSIRRSLQLQIKKSKKIELSYDEDEFMKKIKQNLRELL